TLSDDFSSLGIPARLINLENEYAPSDFDVRHSLSGALTLDLQGAPGPLVVRALTRNWGVDSLLRFRTGLPTNLTTRILFESSSLDARPNVIAGVPQVLLGSQYPGGMAVNPAAFAVPPANTQGNFARNSLRFFKASQCDVALRRQFSLTER